MDEVELSRFTDATVHPPVAGRVELSHPVPGAVVAALLGEHDLATSGELRTLLAREVERNEVVVVDVSAVDFLDCSVLACLARADGAATAHGSRLVLQVGTAPIVRRLLDLSGLLDSLSVAHTRAEAIDPPPRQPRAPSGRKPG